MFCNPHNPTGRVFSRAELEALAEVVLEHRLWVLSDELHADLVFDGRHVPFASLSPRGRAAHRDPVRSHQGLQPGGLEDRLPDRAEPRAAGPRQGGRRLLPARRQHARPGRHAGGLPRGRPLAGRRARLPAVEPRPPARALGREAPDVRAYAPEGTYLSWLDFRATAIGDDPAARLLERGRLALNCGRDYGLGGDGFARFNVATSRALLDAAIDRLVATVTGAATRVAEVAHPS
jgi:cysteine-S-conjugate beta-lyase